MKTKTVNASSKLEKVKCAKIQSINSNQERQNKQYEISQEQRI